MRGDGKDTSESSRSRFFDRRGNKREGERSVFSYVTEPESRSYPMYIGKDTSEKKLFLLLYIYTFPPHIYVNFAATQLTLAVDSSIIFGTIGILPKRANFLIFIYKGVPIWQGS